MGASRRFSLDQLRNPIVQAPMAGGPSTPALAAAVTDAGGLGCLAAGYKTVEEASGDVRELRALTHGPFGVNIFAPPGPSAAPDVVAGYAESLRAEAKAHGIALGEPRHDDDGYEEKLAMLREAGVDVVSFTFGCPSSETVEDLHGAGSAVWVTVTTVLEAVAAADAGADALVVQGFEAGGHRGSFDDADPGDVGLLALLQLVARQSELPLVATGGIATGRAVAAVLVAGASAAQLGSAFMLTPEAATSSAHREALSTNRVTALTRAFTGRTARGFVNRFMREHGPEAPSAYPEIHHLTSSLRAAARERGDAEALNLWAGQAAPLSRELPAAEVVRRLAEEARDALGAASRRWTP